MLTGVANHVVKKQILGEILIKRGVITLEQLNKALEVQKKENGYLGEILVNLGYIKERDIVAALVVQCHFPYIAVDKYDINEKIRQIIPRDIILKHKLIPLDRVGGVLSVVMANPLDGDIKAELHKITGCKIVSFISERQSIERAIKRWYAEERVQ